MGGRGSAWAIEAAYCRGTFGLVVAEYGCGAGGYERGGIDWNIGASGLGGFE